MKVSNRGSKTQSSPIRKLIPYAEKAESRGIKVLRLNIGQPDIETPYQALDAVCKFNEKVLAYSPSDGFETLKEKVAIYLKNYDVNMDTTKINITTGGSEAILFAIAAVCDPGDNIIIQEPFYANYKSFATMLGVDIVPVTTSVENRFHLSDFNELENKINKKTRAILLCNPSNPTGTVYTLQEIEQYASLALKHDIFIISDEVYREFVYDGKRFVSPMILEGFSDRVIITDSISKRYSSCGARVGFIASGNKDVIDAVKKFSMARLSPPTIGQKIAERAFSMDFTYFQGIIDEYRARRDILFEELEKTGEMVLSKPEGGFYMMVKLPGIVSEDFARFLLEDFSIKGETVLIAPAPGFYATQGLGVDEIRIAFVLNQEKTKRAARIITEGYREFINRQSTGIKIKAQKVGIS